MDKIEKVKEKYQDRIISYLDEVRKELEKNNIITSIVEDYSSDDIYFGFMVYKDEKGELENSLDVSFHIYDAKDYDAKDYDDIEGLNFGIEIVSYDGEIVGELIPYNYSSNVWVLEDEDIEERFNLIVEESNIYSMIKLIKEFYKKE